MIAWLSWNILNFIGYRRVLYFPSQKGLGMADFYGWEYAPSLPKIDYTERNFPFQMYWGK